MSEIIRQNVSIYAGLRNYVEKKQVLINIPGDLSRFRCPILEECQSSFIIKIK
jgi:hypothetical protein